MGDEPTGEEVAAPARTGPDYAIARAFREKVKWGEVAAIKNMIKNCLLYTSPSPRDGLLSRMPSSA